MAPELKRKLDYSDYMATPDDGKRYEILDGDLCVNPSPSPRHQRVSRRLQLQLERYFHKRSIGEVFNAPIDLILGHHDVMVPNLVIVEILSPSTQTQDRGTKAHRYAESGVEHYWIVDPKAKRLECHRLTGRVYQRAVEIEGESTFEHPDLAELKIDLNALW